jgi:predicted Ser/Thr protein kinase
LDDFKAISIKKGSDGKHLDVNNPTSYQLIGKGYQGAVFRLNEEQCVKIYIHSRDADSEAKALRALQERAIAPKVFETGPNYIVMEYLKGPNLKTYLRQQGSISESISQQILVILKEMKRAGFTRLNKSPLQHFIVTEQEVLKVIDLAGVYRHTKYPFATYLFQNLRDLGLLNTFLGHAKKLEPKMYDEWKQTMKFKQ